MDDEWDFSVLNDTVIVMKRIKPLSMNTFQTRRDYQHYIKLFMIFRDENTETSMQHIKEFQAFLTQLQSDYLSSKDTVFEVNKVKVFDFNFLNKNAWSSLLEKELPPNIVSQNYSITFWENTPSHYAALEDDWQKIALDFVIIKLALIDEAYYTSYTKYFDKIHNYALSFWGFIDWGLLMKIKYPTLFEY